jgi:hypothetical protein
MVTLGVSDIDRLVADLGSRGMATSSAPMN